VAKEIAVPMPGLTLKPQSAIISCCANSGGSSNPKPQPMLLADMRGQDK